MDESFNFGRVLKNHEKKHKSKPLQFTSVAAGVQKRLENKLKNRRSSRLTIFDSIRNLSRSASPAPLSKAQQKMEHRKQQLEKWKEEKQKKKKEAASLKKKPFVAGVPHASLKYVPPPPVRVKPSTSGVTTRSQRARATNQVQEKQTTYQSFAPQNATFKPPQLKNDPKVPYVKLEPVKPSKTKKTTFTFEPILHKSVQNHFNNEHVQTISRTQSMPTEAKVTRSKTSDKKAQNIKEKTKLMPADVKVTRSKASDAKPKDKTEKTAKPLPKTNKTLQSASSSETDSIKSPVLRSRKSLPAPRSPALMSSTETDSSDQSPVHATRSHTPIQTRTRKTLPNDSPVLVLKTPRKSTPLNSRVDEPKHLTPKNSVPRSESSSEEKLRSPKPPLDVMMTPEQITEEAKKISPCVTMSRGKDNARREMKMKLEQGLLDEDTSDIDNIDHFRRQLASEINRMTEMCDTWDRISEQTVLPDSVQECVLGAVGQARLLMSQKMQQFATLVERCARPEPGAALVTPADLHGFWDMVFMQVENVDMRFKKLEELRARGWVEDQPVIVAKKVKAAKVAKAKPVGGASRIKEMIAAARKAKKDQLSMPVEKTFEAGFFCVRSPVRSPAPHTPLGKPSLLKAVLSSEANKSASKNSASFAMLRASVLGKNIDCDGVAPLPLTPLPQMNATPGRSILKQNFTDTANRTSKSIKMVLFDQSDETPSDTDKEQELENVLEAKEINVDSGLSSMDVEKEEKENSCRKSHRLMRQDATEDRSPVMTRSRRKSHATPQEKTKTPQEKTKTQEKVRRSTRKSKVLEDLETNVMEGATPKRAPRRRREVVQELAA